MTYQTTIGNDGLIFATGNFGTLFYVRGAEHATTRLVVKKIPKRLEIAYLCRTHHRTSLVREARILRDMENHSFPRLHDAFQDDLHCYLIMDLLPGCCLQDYLYLRTILPQMITFQRWARQLQEMVIHLHEHNVYYLDWKPLNMLVGPTGRLYLVDFGLAFGDDDLTNVPLVNTMAGTLGYPTRMRTDGSGATNLTPQDGRAINWFGMGWVLYQLVHTDRHAVGINSKIKVEINSAFKHSGDDSLDTLLHGLLTWDKTQRLGWLDESHVSASPFFNNEYDDNETENFARYTPTVPPSDDLTYFTRFVPTITVPHAANEDAIVYEGYTPAQLVDI